MNNRKLSRAVSRMAKEEEITKNFVRIFYGILNSHPEQLFQFYGNDSTVIVSEIGSTTSPCSRTADSREEIRQLLTNVFKGMTVKIKTAIPQGTVDDGLLLLNSGILTKSESTSKEDSEHYFTQALVLAPQRNGYYILNDTLHIMGSLVEAPNKPDAAESSGMSGRFYPLFNGSIVPPTPRPVGHSPQLSGTRKSISSEDGTQEIKSDSDSDDSPPRTTKSRSHHVKTHSFGQQQTRQQPRTSIKQFIMPTQTCRHPNGRALGVAVGVPPPQSGPPSIKPNVNGSDPRAAAVPPGHGVFIARLPFGIQADEVERAFSVFGPVLNGAEGIQVRDGRNGCYAFVTFESRTSAMTAIEQGAVVQGKRVFVEPRYPRDAGEPQFIPPTAPPPPPPVTLTVAPPPMAPMAPN